METTTQEQVTFWAFVVGGFIAAGWLGALGGIVAAFIIHEIRKLF